jgi:glycogen(starch) synthase
VRVLTVGNLYPPHHQGGYELVWRSAVEHLRGLGHTVRVLAADHREAGVTAPDDPDVHRDLRWYWRDFAFPRMSLPARLALERDNAAVLRRHVDDLRPDVVSWWSMGGMSLSLIEQARRAGLPAVAFVHDEWLIYGPRVDGWLRLFAKRPRLGALVARRTGLPTRVEFPAAAEYVFVSDTVRRKSPGLPRTAVAHSGIDPSFIDPRPERPWSWRLLSVGRIDERKGIGTAIEALTHLPDATLTVVGSGDEETLTKLRAQAADLGLENRVEFAGSRPRAELPDTYAEHDVALFPVLWEEPWGLVPIEAMALGRPVVATGRGGSGEYLRDGENCLLYAAGDASALAAAVRRLAAEPDLRARLHEGGLETAPLHTETVFNDAVVRHLEAAAG